MHPEQAVLSQGVLKQGTLLIRYELFTGATYSRIPQNQAFMPSLLKSHASQILTISNEVKIEAPLRQTQLPNEET